MQSVLPADTAQRVPKPPRDVFELESVPVVAGRGASSPRSSRSACSIWWWIRRRRRPKPAVVVDPFERAVAEFQRIEALGLLDAGERGRYVALMVEVAARLSRRALRRGGAVADEHRAAARGARAAARAGRSADARCSTDADLIKFARRPVSTERAREIGREARDRSSSEEHKASRVGARAGGGRMIVARRRSSSRRPWVLASCSCCRSGGSFAAGAARARSSSRASRVLGAGPRAGRAHDAHRCSCCATCCWRRRSSRWRARARARTPRIMTSEGINIVLAIDLSSSMLAQDFQPQNRLEVAKDVVKQVHRRAHERSHRRRRVRRRGADAGAADDGLSGRATPRSTTWPRASSRTARRSAPRSRRRRTGCAMRRADRA